MVNLDCEKIYTLYELEQQKPSGYRLLEKNHRYKKHPIYDRYKIVDIIEDIGLYTQVSRSYQNVEIIDGIIIIEMVRPES
ncbi:MAG: hypothetical protein K2G55_16225 [Lachnospiraceae bacterium]|nr:hypothetical protein [Lachnospiraceae bacterium]